ncbi:MAG: divergent polysaccharide deacetylase family protein [Candidatus Omnitrophota bacterium]
MKKITLAVLLVVAIVFAGVYFLARGRDLTNKSYRLDLLVFSVLRDRGLPAGALSREKYDKKSIGKIRPARILHITKEYNVPPSFSQWGIQNTLEETVKKYGFILAHADFVYGKDVKLSTFTITYKKLPVYTLILYEKLVRKAATKPAIPPELPLLKKKPRVAIVIDDWGYSKNNLELLWQIKQPLTLAILPNLTYSKEIANLAHKKGKEVILHLPLEAKGDSVREEQGTVHTSMNDAQISERLLQDLNSVPYAKGISNHQGSLATESRRVMSVIFAEMKKKKLYFLDSLSTPNSVCESLAKEMGVRFIERDTFLDNSDDPDEIRRQLYEVAADAAKNGFAVGIGHDRERTLQAINETLPLLEKSGIKFVFLSELIK